MRRQWINRGLRWLAAGILAVSTAGGAALGVASADLDQARIWTGNEYGRLTQSYSQVVAPAETSLQLAIATPILTVSEAIAKGNSGEVAVVRGYIVGHASGANTADWDSPFGNDYNFLIADTPQETRLDKLIDVQVPAKFRAQFGLMSNPDLIGQQVEVTGALTAYNLFPGLKSVTKIEIIAAESDPCDTEPGHDDSGPDDPGTGNSLDPVPGSDVPILPDGTGKKVLFDNTHAQTAGAADWVIDGAFSDFADALRADGFTVEQLERSTPHQFDTPAITYSRLRNYDVFIIPEANIPFKTAEQDAIVQYVQEGGAVFFISDHYNADRNKNRWDSSEVFNGYRRGAYTLPTKGMSVEEAASPAMQNVESSDWLSEHFGVRFRYNALGDVNANDIVEPAQAFGITAGVQSVAMHAGSTLAITDPTKAKGIVYVPTGVPKWGPAVDSGVYNGGGRAEGPYAAVAKVGLGKAAFIGDSSPVEDASPKYVREENGSRKTTYDGFKEADDAVFLIQTVRWLAHAENYTSLTEVPGLVLDTVTVLRADEAPAASVEPVPEPWAAPAAGYKWYDPSTFKPGSYGSSQSPVSQPSYDFVHQDPLPNAEEFTIQLTVGGLAPGQTVSGLKVGIYLPGGEQIASFKNSNGAWSAYGYSPEFSVTADTSGNATVDLSVKLKPNQAGTANLRLKQGSDNVITRTVTIANVGVQSQDSLNYPAAAA